MGSAHAIHGEKKRKVPKSTTRKVSCFRPFLGEVYGYIVEFIFKIPPFHDLHFKIRDKNPKRVKIT